MARHDEETSMFPDIQFQCAITSLSKTLRSVLNPSSVLIQSQAMLLTHLFENQFTEFVKTRLIEYVRGEFWAAKHHEGGIGARLGDAFVLTK